jgi:hypothetical protein
MNDLIDIRTVCGDPSLVLRDARLSIKERGRNGDSTAIFDMKNIIIESPFLPPR